jgi:glycine/D-amino acid oxidase-like deaminating enzyme
VKLVVVGPGLMFEMHRKGCVLLFENRGSFEHRVRRGDAFAPFGMVPELLDADALHEREPCLSERARHALFFPGDRQVEPDSLTAALGKRLRELGAQVREHVNVVGFEQPKTVRDLTRDVASGRRSALTPYGHQRFLRSSGMKVRV